MRNMLKLSYCFLISLFLLSGITNCYGQHSKPVHRSLRDSLRRAVLQRDSLMRTYKHSDNSLNAFLQKIEYYNSLYNQDYSTYSLGFDTAEINQKLPSMERRMGIMGRLIANDRSSTLGYLFTIRDMVSHFADDLQAWQKELSNDDEKLDKIQSNIIEFKKDTTLHVLPTDTSLRSKYLSQISVIQQKWARLDTGVRKSLIRIGLLQNRVTAQDLLLLDINDQIDLKIHDFTIRSLTNEYGYIWENNTQNIAPFDTVARKTTRLNSRLLKYFFDPKTTSHINIVSHIATIVVFIIFFSWIYTSRKKLIRVKDHYQSTLDQPHYIVKHAIVSSLLISTILGLYLYDQPPFVFLEILLVVMMACIGVLIKSIWPAPLFKFWATGFVLLLFYGITNLFIEVSYFDRIFLLILSGASIAAGVLFLQQSKNSDEGYPSRTQLAVKLFIICHAVAFILNIIGRFSLAKIIGVTTVFNLCLGFGFYLLIQILMESLFLQLEANKIANNFSSYLDFKILQNKFKNVLVKIAVILWLIKLTENLDIDDFIYEKAGDFLSHPYKLGTASFTFGSVAIFIAVLWVSIIISRVISYFYDYAEQQSTATSDAKKNKTSILLIRLSVFTIGFIAAIALSGIPMTEVTIVIGALGVGIGFGLQNIVNNLVSGVILAFEKPVQVGDIIEVGNRSGTIKEIGIRASKIEAGDGSELIVPNGDLISQHVINWTLSNNNRRVELIVGVAYGSDIAKVEGILKKIVRGREDIMQSPPPLVFLHNFSDSSVDFRLLFWAADIDKWLSLKSDVMSAVYTEFEKEGVEIPHPKRDIQVFFPEGTSAEVKSPEIKEIFPSKNTTKKSPPGSAE